MSVAVFLESYKGKIVKAASEAVSAAKMIAEKQGTDLFGIALDENVDEIIAKAGIYGITMVKASSHITLYHPTMYARFIANAASGASTIVFPGTVWGREISPQVCVKVNGTPVSDIIEVVEGNQFKRSIHGNKIISTVETTGTAVITVRAGVFDLPDEGEGTATKEEISAEVVDADSFMKLAEILAAATGKIELTEADIIVSGGRGTGGPENFDIIEALAEQLGAAVGASRAVVDAGWRPHSDQVGQTGKFVSPKVYVAVGISGAIQHLAGMSTSEIIVAINKDEEAPIFKIADYGVVGDLFEVVPALTEAIKKIKAAN